MCKSCGSNVAPLRSFDVMEGITMQKLYDSGNYKLVRYNGRTFTTTIGSPTGVIAKDGLKNYGRAQAGDILLVHTDDIKKTPQVFTLLQKDTEPYNVGLKKYELTDSAPKAVSKKTATVAEVKATVEPTVEVVTIEEKKIEKINEEELKDTGGRLLSKDEALPLKEFQEKYGFTHHMQVLAKVKSGELKSYKDNEDKTFIYHYD